MNRRRILAWMLMLMMLMGMLPEASAYMDDQGNVGAPAHTHNWNGYEPGREATCTESGYHYEYCTICEEYYDWNAKEVTDPPKGHTWERSNPTSRDAVTKEPTCTEPGEKVQYCLDCGASRTVAVPALGHDFSGWQTAKEATCTEAGSQTHICYRCGLQESKAIDPLGHDFGAWTVTTQPTCTETGVETSTCSRCGFKNTQSIPALGHQYGAWKIIEDSTCAKEGTRQTTCARCGRTVTDAVEKKPHTWGEWYILVEAGDWEAGVMERQCQVCGTTEQKPYYKDGTILPENNGDRMKYLQDLLNENGFDCGKADGVYGPKTQSAIEQAEQAAGHPATGIGWTGLIAWLEGGAQTGEPVDQTPHIAATFEEVEGGGTVGEAKKTLLVITNVGAVPVQITTYDIVDADGSSMIDLEGYVEWSNSEDNVDILNFLPGQTYFLDYYITPQPGEENKCLRTVTVHGVSVYTGEPCQDSATMNLPMYPEQKEGPAIQAALESSGGILTGAVGEKVPGVLRFTNVGTTGLILRLAEVVDADSNVMTDQGETFSSPYGGTGDAQYNHLYLRPGEFVFMDFTAIINDHDASVFELWRRYSISAWEAGESDGGGLWYNEESGCGDYCLLDLPVKVVPPTEGTELGLLVIPPDYTGWTYGLSEMVEIPYTIKNTGSAPLFVDVDSFTYGDGTGISYISYVNMWPPEADYLEPGNSFVLRVRTKVTEKDAEAPFATRLFSVNGHVPEDHTLTTVSNEVDVHWAIANSVELTGEEYSLQADPPDTTGWAFAEGEIVTLPFKVTNTGKKALRIWSTILRLEDGFYDDKREGLIWPLESNNLQPGESVTLGYTTVVTPQDVQAGYIYREFQVLGADSVDDPTVTGIQSNTAPVKVPLREPGNGVELGLQVRLQDTTGWAYAPGESFDLTYTVTNTGKVPLVVNTFAWLYEDQSYCNEDQWGTLPSIAMNLQPGASFDLTMTVTVNPKDVGTGYVWRVAEAKGFPFDGDGNVDYSRRAIGVDQARVDIRQPDPGTLGLDFTVVPEDTTGWMYEVGDLVPVKLTITNTGKDPICVYTLSWSNNLLTDGYRAESWVGPVSDTPMQPGETSILTMLVQVLPSDVSAGKVLRHPPFVGFPENNTDDWEQALYRTPDVVFGLQGGDVGDPVPLIPPVTIAQEEPKLTLAASFSPMKAEYDPGDEITVNWTLTNIGGEACSFGGVDFFTDPGDLSGSRHAFVAPDAACLLNPFGGSKSGTDKFTLVDTMAIGDVVTTLFEGYGRSVATGEVVAVSNKVVETFPLSTAYTGWVIPPDTDSSNVQVTKRVIAPFSVHPLGYQKGETVHYEIVVENVGDIDLIDVEVVDPLKGKNEDSIVDIITSLPAHTSVTLHYDHEIRPEEVGGVTNIATATWIDPGSGDPVSSPSNPVTISTIKLPEPLPKELLVFKYRMTPYPHAAGGKGFFIEGEQVTFLVSVRNNSGEALYGVVVTDPLSDDPGKVIDVIPVLGPLEGKDIYFTYEITDLNCMYKKVANTATATGTDAGGKKHTATSDPAEVNAGCLTGDPTPGTGKKDDGDPMPFGVITLVNVSKQEISTPANGSYYQEGEIIRYRITVRNDGETPVTDVFIYDSLGGIGGTEIGYAEMLNPGESRNCFFNYKVTAPDVAAGKVVNSASAKFTLASYYTDTAVSNKVVSDTDGIPDVTENGKDPDDGPGKLTGTVKLPGEPEEYRPCSRTLTRKGDGAAEYALHTCVLHQPIAQQAEQLVAAATDAMGRKEAWEQAGELWRAEIDAIYEAVYEAADSLGKATVLNERVMYYAQLEVWGEALALVFPDHPELVAQKVTEALAAKCADLCYEVHTAPEARSDSYLGHHEPIEAQQADGCTRTIAEKQPADAKRIENLCAEHAATDAAVLAALREVATENNLISRFAGPEARAALEEAWAKAQKLWQVQLDASTNQRYRPASKEDRKLVAADRMTFDNWLTMHKLFLDMLYPAGSEAAEVLTKAIMNRTVDYCLALHEAQ